MTKNDEELNKVSSLDEWRYVRPRLFLTKEKISELKALLSSSQYLEFAKTVACRANSAHTHPPNYRDDGGNLWQRGVGNTIPYLAITYLLSGNKYYLNKTKTWILGACEYSVWHDCLGAAHLIFGVSVAYDWLYDDLDDESRDIVRDKLVQESLRELPDRSLANHYWIGIAAIGTAGMALYDEREEGIEFIDRSLTAFKDATRFLSNDGASQEGIGYWQYAMEYMLKFMCLSNRLLGIRLHHHSWWENTAYYGIYLSTPKNAWVGGGMTPMIGSTVDFGDTSRGNWYGPDYIMRALATEYNNGYAQWFAEKTNEAGIDNPVSSWLNMIWYDPEVESKHVERLPTLKHFEDMGIVSSRSDWSGNESLVVFKCGPALGHHATKMVSYDAGHINYINRNSAGHCNPDSNSFVLFGNGEWLVRNPGYVLRRTDYQNTLLVDEEGQLGQEEKWWLSDEQVRQNLHPRVLKVLSGPAFDHIMGDAASTYPDKIEKFERHLIFMKPSVLIVIDDIVSNNPQTTRKLELLFHLEHSAYKSQDGAYIAKGENSILRTESLIPDYTLDGKVKTILSRSYVELPRYVVSLTKNASKWRNAVAFSWADVNSSPVKVGFEDNGDVWMFTADCKNIMFSWPKKEVKVETNDI